MTKPPRSAAGLTAELNQLREALENAYQRNRHVETRLRELLRATKLEPPMIEVFDVFGPSPRKPQSPPKRHHPPAGAAWLQSRGESVPLRPTPGHANLTLKDAELASVGFSVCGFADEELERIVAAVAAKQTADRNFAPVFLTDSTATHIFRRHRFVFEYFPMTAEAQKLVGVENWRAYAAARLAFIKCKYALTEIVVFGKTGFGVL